MKHTALLIATSLLVGGAHAADYGLGVALNNSNEIFVPINVRSDLRIEPSLAFSRTDFSDENSTAKSRFYELKTGVFSIRPMGEGFNILFGGRLGYQKVVQRQADINGVFFDSTSSGFIIEPTLAMEYLPFKQLALGAEASLRYSRLTGKNDQGFDRTETDSITRITVKYFY